MTRRTQVYAQLSYKSIGYVESDALSQIGERPSLFLYPGRGARETRTEKEGDAPVCASRRRRKRATAAPRNDPQVNPVRSRPHRHQKIPPQICRDDDRRLYWHHCTALRPPHNLSDGSALGAPVFARAGHAQAHVGERAFVHGIRALRIPRPAATCVYAQVRQLSVNLDSAPERKTPCKTRSSSTPRP
jgi:hypothetical protein